MDHIFNKCTMRYIFMGKKNDLQSIPSIQWIIDANTKPKTINVIRIT